MLINFNCHFLLKPNKFQKEVKISIDKKLSSKMMIFEITQVWRETLKNVVLPFIIEILLKYTHTHNSKKLGSEQTRHNGVRVNDVILVQVIDSCF